MKILKIKDVKTPNRGTPKSAGFDFFVPEKNDFFVKNPETGDLHGPLSEMELSPNQAILIPSGIKARVPEGYALIAFNKSGVSTKRLLVKGAEIVDEDYSGEIHIHVINVGSTNTTIKAGEKLIQFSLIAQNYDIIEEVSSETELFENLITERGEGGFGSTGTH